MIDHRRAGPERFARDIERHAPARSPATLEFILGYPAEQLVTIRQFVADVTATTPAEPTTPTGPDRRGCGVGLD